MPIDNHRQNKLIVTKSPINNQEITNESTIKDPIGFSAVGGYDVAADGRFLMIPESGADPNRAAAPTSGIVVVQNWVEELKQRVSAK